MRPVRLFRPTPTSPHPLLASASTSGEAMNGSAGCAGPVGPVRSRAARLLPAGLRAGRSPAAGRPAHRPRPVLRSLVTTAVLLIGGLAGAMPAAASPAGSPVRVAATTTAPGYRRVTIRPRPGGSLRWASARYRTAYGDVTSRWSVSGGRFTLDVTVPVNATAEVWVPAATADQVTRDGARFEGMRDGAAVFTVGSGRRHFSARA